MLSDYLGEKKIFTKGPEFWHVGFISPEKHCSEVFFSLGCSLFSRNNVCKQGIQVGKTECFLHTQYLENEANLSAKTTGHILPYLNKLQACKIWSVFDKVYF